MQLDSRDAALLYDMLEAAAAIERYLVRRSRSDLDRDNMLCDAIERRLEIFGEAARGISASLQSSTAYIPWRKIIAVRHILAHEYDEINYDVLWRIVTVYVPEAVRLIKPLLPPNPENSTDKN